jgi:hypothetical protein
MSLIKLATNKMTALMQVGKLSKNAIHSINWRPAEQIAGGLERGNINLAKRYGTIINPTNSYKLGKTFMHRVINNQPLTLLEKIRYKNPLQYFINGIELKSKYRNSPGSSMRTGFIFSNPKAINKIMTHSDDRITNALVNRHELHEMSEMSHIKDNLPRHAFYISLKNKDTKKAIGMGSHANPTVIMKENNDIVRLKPYEQVRQNFLGLRHSSLEDIAYNNLFNHNYGETKISSKRFKTGRTEVVKYHPVATPPNPKYVKEISSIEWNKLISRRRDYLASEGVNLNSNKVVREI